MFYWLKRSINLLPPSLQGWLSIRCLPSLRTMCTDMNSPKLPQNVYHWIDGVEDLEGYIPGGFRPTYLGEGFSDGRYRVIHKLGFGGYSTGTRSFFT